MTKREKLNFYLICIRGAFYGIACLFMSGTILQTFLSEYGVSDSRIGVYASLLSVFNIAATVLFSHLADRVRRINRAFILILLGMTLLFAPMILLCLAETVPAKTVFLVTLVAGGAQAILSSVKGLYDYKLPYLVFDVRNYGLIASVETTVIGLATTLAGLVFSKMVAAMPYRIVMGIGFSAAAVFILLSALFQSLLKLKTPEAASTAPDRQKGSIRQTFCNPLFYGLAMPAFLRGAATGVFNMAAVLALQLGYTSEDTAVMVTISSAASMGGALALAFLFSRINAKKLLTAGSLLCLFFPLIGVQSRVLFFIVYFFVSFGKITVDIAVPTVLYRYVPYEISGEYHAWRLLLNTAGIALASLLTGVLTQTLSPVSIAAIAGVLWLVSSLWYALWHYGEELKPA